MDINKIKGGIFGVAVGDALGVTIEFSSKKDISQMKEKHTEILGGGVFRFLPGDFSDDTDMTICVAEGLLSDNPDYVTEIGNNFVNWENTSPKDIGNTVSSSIYYYKTTRDWNTASKLTHEEDGKTAGNGSLMRTLPVTLFFHNDRKKMLEISETVSEMTHYDHQASICCMFYNTFAANLINSEDKKKSYYESLDECKHLFDNHEDFYKRLKNIEEIDKNDLIPSGFSVETLITSVWNFLKYDDPESVIVETVNLGGDADTTGAVVGGLAGIFYGYDKLPERWVNKIRKKKLLDELCNRIYRKLS